MSDISDTIEWVEITGGSGRAVPVQGHSINTDVIIPARFLKNITWEELGERQAAFHDKRYKDGQLTDHPFNLPQYQGARILLVNKDFGSGSSREHAPQALYHWGIHVIVSESYADIFEKNCRRTGIPAVTVLHEGMETLMRLVQQTPELELRIDLNRKILSYGSGDSYREIPINIPEPTRIALTR